MRTQTRALLAVLLLCAPFTVTAATRHNDDSCDIAVLPAATLLLPYFEVDLNTPSTTGRTTLFTVVNASQSPQIARVTVWTDFAYPVLNFNMFLTGYDVQGVNLYDVIARGILPSAGSGVTPGSRSLANDANPNFLPDAATACALPPAPNPIPASILADVRTALTSGRVATCGGAQVGAVHANAIGYVTIDVVATCNPTLPTDAAYFNELLYDNVLSGDYDWINPDPATGNLAGGTPLVHIRAIPEGGAAAVSVPTNLPWTFYSRLAPLATPRVDRRQPLPSSFSSRFIQGGQGTFNTDFRFWREAVTGSAAACNAYARNGGSEMAFMEEVRFDEHENPTVPAEIIGSPPILPILIIPASASLPSNSTTFPVLAGSGDLGGWMFFNLDNHRSTRPSQNWVVTSMAAEGRFQAAFDATPLANGCSPAHNPEAPIGPGENTTP